MKSSKALACVGLFALSSPLALGALTDITIYDGLPGVTFGSEDPRGIEELNEVEFGNATGSEWDYSAFFVEGTSVSFAGGFNPLVGVDLDASPIGATNIGVGSIFIKEGGPTLPLASNGGANGYLQGAAFQNSNFNFDFAVTLTPDAVNGVLNYGIYALTGESQLESVLYASNREAGPFRLIVGDEELMGSGSVAVTYEDLSAYGIGSQWLTEGIDLSALPIFGGDQWTFYLTQGCGNDSLVGLIPEPGSMAGLAGLLISGAFLRRRR